MLPDYPSSGAQTLGDHAGALFVFRGLYYYRVRREGEKRPGGRYCCRSRGRKRDEEIGCFLVGGFYKGGRVSAGVDLSEDKGEGESAHTYTYTPWCVGPSWRGGSEDDQ